MIPEEQKLTSVTQFAFNTSSLLKGKEEILGKQKRQSNPINPVLSLQVLKNGQIHLNFRAALLTKKHLDCNKRDNLLKQPGCREHALACPNHRFYTCDKTEGLTQVFPTFVHCGASSFSPWTPTSDNLTEISSFSSVIFYAFLCFLQEKCSNSYILCQLITFNIHLLSMPSLCICSTAVVLWKPCTHAMDPVGKPGLNSTIIFFKYCAKTSLEGQERYVMKYHWQVLYPIKSSSPTSLESIHYG